MSTAKGSVMSLMLTWTEYQQGGLSIIPSGGSIDTQNDGLDFHMCVAAPYPEP